MVKKVCIVLIFLITSIKAASQGDSVKPDCFNFESIKPYSKLLVEPSCIKATDGTQLAYYEFLASKPRATIIFYHGGALWSCGAYHHMAHELAQKHNITTYLFDIRGHGNSQGERGDAPSAQAVWQDVDAAIEFVKSKNPDAPLYLAGHSSGAGLIVNYDAFKKNKSGVAGYLLLSPYLGDDSQTVRADQKLVPSVRGWIFALQGITSTNFFDHWAAVYFDYPTWLKAQDPHALSYYTTAMAKATSPYQARQMFTKITTPCALWVGEKDEQFYPEKVIEFTSLFPATTKKVAAIVPNAAHISIILDAPQLFADAIGKLAK